MKNSLSHYRQQGFTLIEVLVSMALFILGLLSILSLQLNAFSSLGDARIKKQAMFYASSYQEIQVLSRSRSSDISLLNEKWLESIQSSIPDVEISYEVDSLSAQVYTQFSNPSQKISTQNNHIKLAWPSSQKVAHCKLESKDSKDCLRL